MEDHVFFEKVIISDEIWVLLQNGKLPAYSFDNNGYCLSVWHSKKNVELFKAHRELDDTYTPVCTPVSNFINGWLNDSDMNIQEIFIDNNGFDEKCLCYSKEEFIQGLIKCGKKN